MNIRRKCERAADQYSKTFVELHAITSFILLHNNGFQNQTTQL